MALPSSDYAAATLRLSGKKLLLLHGDEFDKEVNFGRFHAWLGDNLYDFLLFLNRWSNRIRRALGGRYFSLAAFIKSKVPGAQQAIARYRDAAVAKAKRSGFDGVVVVISIIRKSACRMVLFTATMALD